MGIPYFLSLSIIFSNILSHGICPFPSLLLYSYASKNSSFVFPTVNLSKPLYIILATSSFTFSILISAALAVANSLNCANTTFSPVPAFLVSVYSSCVSLSYSLSGAVIFMSSLACLPASMGSVIFLMFGEKNETHLSIVAL